MEDNGFYHVYNRGVEKRNIFLEPADYAFFLHLIKGALLPPELKKESEENAIRPRRKNFFGKIDLLCYCLMPNHFHFLLRQNDISSVTDFIRSISTAFQGIFKAIDINDENSYEDYLLKKNTPWLNKSIILNYFGNKKINEDKNYRSFVEPEKENNLDLSDITLENELEDD